MVLDHGRAGPPQRAAYKSNLRLVYPRLLRFGGGFTRENVPEGYTLLLGLSPAEARLPQRWVRLMSGAVSLIQLVQGDQASPRDPKRTGAPPR